MADVVTLFASVALARRVELSACSMLRASAAASDGFFIDVGRGGTAVFRGVGSPSTKVMGLGFDEALDVSALERVEQVWDAHGAEVVIELCTLARAGVAETICARGYLLAGFEDVLLAPLDADRRAPELPASTSITHVGADDLETWVQVSADGFLHADNEGVAHHETFSREILERALRSSISQHYLAWRDGEPAAAASMRIVDGVAWLNGSATLPAHRRRGLQTALVQHRLALARDEGADIATMTTSPGSRSKHNAERRGFALAYSRAVLRRPHRASRA